MSTTEGTVGTYVDLRDSVVTFAVSSTYVPAVPCVVDICTVPSPLILVGRSVFSCLLRCFTCCSLSPPLLYLLLCCTFAVRSTPNRLTQETTYVGLLLRNISFCITLPPVWWPSDLSTLPVETCSPCLLKHTIVQQQ